MTPICIPRNYWRLLYTQWSFEYYSTWCTWKLSTKGKGRRSQWPRGLRRKSEVARLMRLWVRMPPRAWIFVCREGCVLSGRGLCDELITLPEESYRLWCVVVCDLETSWMRRPWPTGGCCAKNKQKVKITLKVSTDREGRRGIPPTNSQLSN